MLAVAGSGIDSKTAMAIGVPGIFLISIGGFFISTMQALITAQYAKDRQGECSGVLSQLNLITTIPSYAIALLFSYTLSSDASFYWPGISYAMVSLSCPINFCYNLDKNYFV
jgi:ABC-type proline/glycine betaine transport system permease subunit